MLYHNKADNVTTKGNDNSMNNEKGRDKMKRCTITDEALLDYRKYLLQEEKSKATIEKYLRDVVAFEKFLKSGTVTKEIAIAYKKQLQQNYAVSSVNSIIASLNHFFQFQRWNDCCVKRLKVQRQTYCKEEKELTQEEYKQLVFAAKQKKNERLSMIIQTICSTGIRISELSFFTVESLQKGQVTISSKNKTRVVFIPKKLQQLLQAYIRQQKIDKGKIFITRTGKAVNRSNIWAEMKALCKQTDIDTEKVFPHNLRHLFARSFYEMDKDIAKLADVLGHSSIETTRIYIVSTGKEHRQLLDRLQLIV